MLSVNSMEYGTKKYRKLFQCYDVQLPKMEVDERNDMQTVILQNLMPWKTSNTCTPKLPKIEADRLVASYMTLKQTCKSLFYLIFTLLQLKTT